MIHGHLDTENDSDTAGTHKTDDGCSADVDVPLEDGVTDEQVKYLGNKSVKEDLGFACARCFYGFNRSDIDIFQFPLR